MAQFEMDPVAEQDLATQVLEDMQLGVDEIYRQCKGQSTAAVTDALQRTFGTALVEPTLTCIADAISRGDHVTITT